ncbi:hypothetical protein B484DRAFT_442723 [Ochromonadaceae sp. CCMP2298]|nr:hypothetical protein B484DRAFT_442723 [Ochromonadaceae sp. CCMP2298]
MSTTTCTPSVIYHMCDKDLWEATQDGAMYFPPTYSTDGFIHATAFPADLVATGTHFYKASRGSWICLSLDPALLPVKYEPAAAVGATETFDATGVPKYPHIYGGISPSAVLGTYAIRREADGTFVGIAGLTE